MMPEHHSIAFIFHIERQPCFNHLLHTSGPAAVLFDGRFEGVYQIPALIGKVTPEQIKNFAAKYLAPENRTIINRVPVPAVKAPAAPGGAK